MIKLLITIILFAEFGLKNHSLALPNVLNYSYLPSDVDQVSPYGRLVLETRNGDLYDSAKDAKMQKFLYTRKDEPNNKQQMPLETIQKRTWKYLDTIKGTSQIYVKQGLYEFDQQIKANSKTDLSLRPIILKDSLFNAKYQTSLLPPVNGRQCPTCLTDTANLPITEAELTKLRIKFIKNEILEKLKLKERPNVSSMGLPKPIYENSTNDFPDDDEEDTSSKDFDAFYAETKKQFIFLEIETKQCKLLTNHSDVCLSLDFNVDFEKYDVNGASLWIHSSSPRLPKQCTISVHEAIEVGQSKRSKSPHFSPIFRAIAIQPVVVQEQWIKIDIEWQVKKWLVKRKLKNMLMITLKSCNVTQVDNSLHEKKAFRTFIVINKRNPLTKSRHKRGINCGDGVSECCREKLYISFKDIGWGDWILHPPGYDAYFCRGSCRSVASITQSISQHTNILQKIFFASEKAEGGQRFELTPCCTAKKYSPLQMVFMDTNNTAAQKTFPNMVVDSCGCR